MLKNDEELISINLENLMVKRLENDVFFFKIMREKGKKFEINRKEVYKVYLTRAKEIAREEI